MYVHNYVKGDRRAGQGRPALGAPSEEAASRHTADSV